MGIRWRPRVSTWGLLALALAVTTETGGKAAAAQELPPAIEADRLLLLAEQQIQDEDFGAAFATLSRIVDLQVEHDLQLPPPFWFSHARVAMRAGLPGVARTSALRYLEITGQGGERYAEALAVLNETEGLTDRDERVHEALLRNAESTSSGHVFRDCSVCPVMVGIPAGSFMMGSPASEANRQDDEGPQRSVTIELRIAVGVYEVTFAEWDACVVAGGCGRYPSDDGGWGRGRQPVINVSWEDAQSYVTWLSGETGKAYRLPNEAEWEYVARAGTQTTWHWREEEENWWDEPVDVCAYANADPTYLRWSEFLSEVLDVLACGDGYTAKTAPVGVFRPNAFGLYDVSGNVKEWTMDCWNAGYRGAPIDGSAWLGGDCTRRVLRGGSWFDAPGSLRSANRDSDLAESRSNDVGFRVARSIN